MSPISKGAMKTPILENDDVENAAPEVDGIFTVNPECPVYQDPFYAEDESVIASFPMDHHCYDQVMVHYWVTVFFFLVALLLSFYVWSFNMLLAIFAIAYLPPDVYEMGRIFLKQRERRCTHVAISTSGIYLDTVNAPDSRVVLNRQVFKYEEYQHCYVDHGYTFGASLVMEYTVMLKQRNSLNPPIVLVKGLLGTQSFADQVNLKIEQANSLETPSPIQENSDYSLLENTTAFADGDSLKVGPDGSFCQDPFYATDKSVISAFAFDHGNGDRTIRIWWAVLLILFVFFILSTCFLGLLGDRDEYWYLELPLVFFWVLALIFFLHWNRMLSIFEYSHAMRRCTHVAIAETGIYVDHVSAPGSRVHMHRTVYPYEDMQYCYVEKPPSVWFGDSKDLVKVKKKNSASATVVFFQDVVEPQLTAERVNSMIQQSTVHTMNSNNTATVV